jgi:hypothetical protein
MSIQALHLTGAALLVLRDTKVLQAGFAPYNVVAGCSRGEFLARPCLVFRAVCRCEQKWPNTQTSTSGTQSSTP